MISKYIPNITTVIPSVANNKFNPNKSDKIILILTCNNYYKTKKKKNKKLNLKINSKKLKVV